MTSMPASRSALAITLAPRSWPSSPGFATTTRIGPAATPITASLKRLLKQKLKRLFKRLMPEVNERYRQHPASRRFAVRTEGEITRWDTFAARRDCQAGLTARSGTGAKEPLRGRRATAPTAARHGGTVLPAAVRTDESAHRARSVPQNRFGRLS